MKKTSIILILSALAVTLLLCSCSRAGMTRAGDTMRNTARRAENFMDNGLNAVENDVENGKNTVIGGMYGANSGYSANAGIGNSTLSKSKKSSPILPSLGDKSKDNKGQINTNNGSLDGGKGDIYDDNDTRRNSLRRDMLSK